MNGNKYINYWTIEKIKEVSLLCKDRIEFKEKYAQASKLAYRYKIMNELFPSKKLPNGYWNEENIRIEAKKYKTKSDFQNHCGTAYNKAKELNIIDDLGFELKGNLYKRCVYAIEFNDNYVYIGLTCDFVKRINKHFKDLSKQSSAREHLIIEPNYRTLILTEYIDKEIASNKEKEYVEFYRNKGWKILNKTKAGGLGGNYSKWNKELVIQTAFKYKCAKDFKYSKDGGGYCHATRNKYSNELKYNKNAN